MQKATENVESGQTSFHRTLALETSSSFDTF